MKRLWTPEEDEELRQMVEAGLPYRKIGRRLKRSEYACRSRASGHGFKLNRAAVLENRRAGRERFRANSNKVEKRRKRLLASFTPLDRAIRSEEARLRNLAGKLGVRHHSEETRAKISAVLTGRTFTEEHRRNIAAARRRMFALIRSGGVDLNAYRSALATGEHKVRDTLAFTEAASIWCSQCERSVSANAAAACQSQWCKAKAAA